MDSELAQKSLLVALGIVMFGLGLTLTLGDFVRVSKHPRAIAVALACQMLILPVAAFGLIKAFDLSTAMAVGMMLLAASPGGMTANVLSHIFKGDVALNISLTAVNAILAVVTIPLIANFALQHFDDSGASVGLQFGKTVQVFAVVIVPVFLGVAVRELRPAFADGIGRPIRMASLALLVAVSTLTLFTEKDEATSYALEIGAVAVLFCMISLFTGYFIPRLFGVVERQAIACSMEIGIHNAALAMTIAISIIGNKEMAVPAAVYSVVMLPLALLFGAYLRWGPRSTRATAASEATAEPTNAASQHL